MKHVTLILSFFLLTTCAQAQGWGTALRGFFKKGGEKTAEKTAQDMWKQAGVHVVSPQRLQYSAEAMELYNSKQGKPLRKWMESSVQDGTESLNAYPGIKEELLEENLQRAASKKLLGAESLKFYLDHSAEWAPTLRKTVTTESVDYSKLIPDWADIIYLGEMHDQTDLMFQQVYNVIAHAKKAHPGKKIIYLTEFVMDIKAGGEQVTLIQNKEDLKERLWAYGAYINRIINMQVPVVGLDNHFAEEFLKDPAQMQKVNQYLANRRQEIINNRNLKEPTNREETLMYLEATRWRRHFNKYFPFPSSLVGMHMRNEHWASIIRQVRAQNPDAVLVVHAGAGHLNYNLSDCVPRKIKHSKPFVINMSGFNQLRDYLYDKSLKKGTTEIIQVTSRRAAITLGSDVEIYF